MLVDSVSASLLISENAAELAAFYRSPLELPLEDEVHDGVPLHYGCNIGDVHFAIHPAEGWPGVQTNDALSPIIALSTSDVNLVVERLRILGIEGDISLELDFSPLDAIWFLLVTHPLPGRACTLFCNFPACAGGIGEASRCRVGES